MSKDSAIVEGKGKGKGRREDGGNAPFCPSLYTQFKQICQNTIKN
jgi:hypothetical protein